MITLPPRTGLRSPDPDGEAEIALQFAMMELDAQAIEADEARVAKLRAESDRITDAIGALLGDAITIDFVPDNPTQN